LNVTDPRWLKRRAQRAGYQDIEDIEPITVAAYIETLQRRAAPPTVNQHMAAIRMMFSWLTEKGVLAMNPAREVKTERFSRTEGKTPAFVDGEVQRLLGAIETSTHTGLRDCALLGVLASAPSAFRFSCGRSAGTGQESTPE
jgi:site-specific recombinase XerD